MAYFSEMNLRRVWNMVARCLLCNLCSQFSVVFYLNLRKLILAPLFSLSVVESSEGKKLSKHSVFCGDLI